MDSKAALAAGTAVLALATLIVVLAHDDREPAAAMAVALVGLVSLLVVWPKVSKWHGIASLALMGAGAGYLAGGGFSTFAKLTAAYLIAGTIALIWHFSRSEKLAKQAATQQAAILDA